MAEIKNPVTIVKGGGQSTLITKTITANGAYNAADDNADGYSSVNVNVSGQTPYEERSMIIASAMTAPEIIIAFNYTCKYKESVIILQSFGDTPVTSTYINFCYEFRQKNGQCPRSLFRSTGKVKTPNMAINDYFGAFETSTTSIITDGKLTSTSVSAQSQMGGIGCVVKLYEIPIGITAMPYNLEVNDVL